MTTHLRNASRAALITTVVLGCLAVIIGCDCLVGSLTAPAAGGGAAGLTADREMLPMIQRSSGNKQARVVYYTPGPHGGLFGTAIQMYMDGETQYEGFQRFIDAVQLGNAYFWGDRVSETLADVYTDEEMQVIADPGALGQAATTEYTDGSIRCEVVANQAPVLYGYHVDVYVEDTYVISIYKACDGCDLFSLAEAEGAASTCVYLLQGWTL